MAIRTVLLQGGYKHLPATGKHSEHSGLYQGKRQSSAFSDCQWASWCGVEGREVVDVNLPEDLCPVCALMAGLRLTTKAKGFLGL